MRRREALAALSAMAMAVAPSSQAAKIFSRKRPLIYMITYRGETEVEHGFKDYFAENHQPVDLIQRDIDQKIEKIAELVAEIRSIKPDLVYCWGTPVAKAVLGSAGHVNPAKNITDIPAVFTMVASPVGAGLTSSLASSGRNITGVTHMAAMQAQVNAMRDYRPFSRVGTIYSAAESNSVAVVGELKAIGDRSGFEVINRPFSLVNGKPDPAEADHLLAQLKAAGVQWLYLPPDSFVAANGQHIIPAAHALGLPTFASAESLMKYALVGLISKYYAVGQFTAYKASQILFDGTPPSAIPIEPLSRYSLLVRIDVAKSLGVLPPLAMFDYAEFV